MKKVITYGTYDLFHQGHLNLLGNAKALGDYLIVGVTTDSFDKERGKLNVKNNVMERIESVRRTGIADEIIIEEYVGQKIDDILKYDVDIFAIGSDWEGKFDYLKEYCEVVYLPRTTGISSTQLRNKVKKHIKIGIIGTGRIANRFPDEALCVDGVSLPIIYNPDLNQAKEFAEKYSIPLATDNFDCFLQNIDAAYIASPHLTHYEYIMILLDNDKHVLCETPLVLSLEQAHCAYALAKSRNKVLLEANKTAYCPAFNHIVTLVKSGVIGDVVDIEASISTLTYGNLRELDMKQAGGSVTENACFPLMAIFRILGTEYIEINFYSKFDKQVDIYTKGVIQFEKSVASFKVGLGVKTEGNLVISGTRGYFYVPAPWWKTDYFEIRYEDVNRNKKYFYAYEKDGLRYEIHEFVSCIVNHRLISHKMPSTESKAIASVIEQFRAEKYLRKI